MFDISAFDEIINRRGTHSSKWDMMEKAYGVSPETGIAMWVADMDFRPPACVSRALQAMVDHGIYGYFGDDRDYLSAIRWWMENRHSWRVRPEWVFSTHGLVNGTALCVDAFSKPGDGVVLFTPVYHAFARVIRAAGREVVECKLVNASGRYEMDFDTYDLQMTGKETMLILCSPHNPGGRVWSKAELAAVAAFAKRHNLVIVSDEIHHDLVYPGVSHTIMAEAAPEHLDRLVMMSATTKTFNIAGCHLGNVIIPDEVLRAKFATKMMSLGISPNSFGVAMATAAYSEEGAAWVNALMEYLDGNRRLFDAGINAIPGLASMELEATYLAWVDFSRTGMAADEFTARVERQAEIAVNHGPTFGLGGEDFLRFNLATPRRVVAEAVERMQKAFADLQ